MCKEGCLEDALHDLEFMERQGQILDPRIYSCLLQTCARFKALASGKLVHAFAAKSGYEQDKNVGSNIINMYVSCGSVVDARKVFDGLLKKNAFTWTAMIAGCAKHGHHVEALTIYKQMRREGVIPNKFTFVGVLNACAGHMALDQGKLIHSHIVKCGYECDVFVASSLVNMYSKCGSLEDAQKVFDKMPSKDVVSWTVMIDGYVRQGCYEKALAMFSNMQLKGVKPNQFTFVSLLRACSGLFSLTQGQWLHSEICKSGLELDMYVCTSLIDMYANCGSIVDARQLFDRMPKRDVVLWTVMITGYAKSGYNKEALHFFQKMQKEGLKADKVIFVSIINACSSLASLEQGRWVHSQFIKSGLESDAFVASALVDMYMNCGSIEEARQEFDKTSRRNVVLWNAMIVGFAKCGHIKQAHELFQEMQKQGFKPDEVTFIGLLHSCASLADLDQGKQLHEKLIQSGLKPDKFLGSTLVHMYVKCGSIKDAEQVFENMLNRDVISWNALISGYTKHGTSVKAIRMFQCMQKEGVKPNEFTFVGLLNACASILAFEDGKQAHCQLLQSGFELNLFVANALIDMYSKCGRLESARVVFDRMLIRDTVSWNSMIAGYAVHGYFNEAFQLLAQMQQKNEKVEGVTLVSVMSVCSHAGLLNEGFHYFKSMDGCEGIKPTVEHGGCMVDLFGRAGCLGEALHFINNSPFEPTVELWISFLASCRGQGDRVLAEHAAEQILRLDPNNDAAYVLLSNVYAEHAEDQFYVVRETTRDTPGFGNLSLPLQNLVPEAPCKQSRDQT
ncbi:hypothetical protein O6H91_Y162500 [Diphasiastrum complanatum]|nr:hypothetical protein O6H91_Y162500 [Diphasiastrum complanatum]